jgi:glycyl-tRNA synthetase
MADAQQQQQQVDDWDALQAQITKQGAQVKQLKKDGGSAEAIAEAVAQLQALKLQSSEMHQAMKVGANSSSSSNFNRKVFDDLILRKMFVVPSFEIHGGVKGLFDLGPPSCGLKVRLFTILAIIVCVEEILEYRRS